MFQIDIYKLLSWLMPDFLRNSNIMLLLQAWVYPLHLAMLDYSRFMQAKLYRLSNNGQVCYLQKVLNDSFDTTQRRIRVVNFNGLNRVYLYPDALLQDVNVSADVYIWPDSFYADSGIDFTIRVPADIATTAGGYAYLVAQINEYRLVGKQFNIERI